jgi:hypothetical protein
MGTWGSEAVSIQEQVGIAINSGNLAPDIATGHERPVDRVAALGAATRGWAWTPRLAELLWRLKYGQDHRCAREAVALLAHELQRRADRKGWRLDGNGILVKFATRVLAEWAHDKCPHCGGKGKTGGQFDPGLTAIKPCTSCNGAGSVERWTRAGIDLLLHGDHDGQVAVPIKAPCTACAGHGRVHGKTFKRQAERECRPCQGSGDARFGAAGRAWSTASIGRVDSSPCMPLCGRLITRLRGPCKSNWAGI